MIGHVVHSQKDQQYYAYGPYVREINLWASYVDQLTLLVPFDRNLEPDPIDLPYTHSNISLQEVPQFNLTSGSEILKTLGKFPVLWLRTWKAMKNADHIHLRCPGNMGLLGALVQIFFPEKVKSAKYAGNWDRMAPKPFSYRIQQKILSSTSLSKKMEVLVYGDWEGESKNIRPFFTASYSESEIVELPQKSNFLEGKLRLIFAGGLTEGKQPMISAELSKLLISNGLNVQLDFYGEGPERKKLEHFIEENSLQSNIILHGNVPSGELKKAFQESHFLIFISQSEGWPKVVAESMFWGCIPVTTRVSCVPQMLGQGERGELVNPEVEEIAGVIDSYYKNPSIFQVKSQKASEWSRQFTLEKFMLEIKSVLFDRN